MYVVVAGGGLAGLVAASQLAEAGAEVELFEARSRVGGRVRTRVVDGYTLDRGFQVLFTTYPAARRELDYESLELRRFASGATIAAPNHRSTVGDPLDDLGVLVPTLLNPDVRIADIFRLYRLQRELRDRAWTDIFASDESTIETYLARLGFSSGFVERFARPFYGGITLDRSLQTSSHIFEYTFKALSVGDIVVPADGMGAIPAQLRARAERAGARIETGVTVSDVRIDPVSIVTGDGDRSPDAVVLATDPKTAGELTDLETPTAAKACTTVHCSLPEHQVLDTDERIVLNAAARERAGDRDGGPNTVVPMSRVAPEYAPAGSQLLSATYLGIRQESDDQLGDAVRTAMTSWFPENHFGELEVVGVDRVEFAQFDQPPGFRDRLPAVDAPDGSVYLAGDYTEWSSIQGALESGRRAARAVLADDN